MIWKELLASNLTHDLFFEKSSALDPDHSLAISYGFDHLPYCCYTFSYNKPRVLDLYLP